MAKRRGKNKSGAAATATQQANQPSSKPAADAIGMVVASRYVLTDVLGADRSGELYRAEHVILRHPLCVLRMSKALSEDSEAVERYHSMLTTAATIESVHLVKFLDFGRDDHDRVFVATEYIIGTPLVDLLRRDGPFGLGAAVDLVEQIGDALGEAHALGITHGGVMPSNIVLGKKKEGVSAKIRGLGLAELLGRVAGSADERFTARGDIYSLGALFYQLCAGLHSSKSPIDRGPLHQEAPLISKEISAVVTKSLAADPADRYPTVERMIEALKEAAKRRAAARRADTLPRGVVVPQGAVKEDDTPAPVDNGATLIGTGINAEDIAKRMAERRRSATQQSEAKTDEACENLSATVVASKRLTETEPETVTEPETLTEPDKSKRSTANQGSSGPIGGLSTSQSGEWFAEGVAAEASVSNGRTDEPYPDVYAKDAYESLDQDEADFEPKRRYIAIVAIGTALVLTALVVGLFMLGGTRNSLVISSPTESSKLKRITPVIDREDRVAPRAAAASDGVTPDSEAKLNPGTEEGSTQVKKVPAKRRSLPSSAKPTSSPKVSTSKKKPKNATRARAVRASKSKDRRGVRTPDVAASSPAQQTVSDAAIADHLQKAQRQLRRGHYSRARTIFSNILRMDSKNARAYAGLGEVAFELGDYRQASRNFVVALNHSPRTVRFRVMLGNSHFKDGRIESAVLQYRRVLEMQPNNAEARGGLEAAIRRLAQGR